MFTNFSIAILLVYINLQLIYSKWKISFKGIDKDNPLKVYEGEYSKITLTVYPESEKDMKSIANITLKDDIFKTSQTIYPINTFVSHSYDIYIGSSKCDYSENSKYTISFEITGKNADDFIHDNNFTIELLKEREPIFEYSNTNPSIFPSMYNELIIDRKNYKNVDPINVSFAFTEESTVKIPSVVIDAFNESHHNNLYYTKIIAPNKPFQSSNFSIIKTTTCKSYQDREKILVNSKNSTFYTFNLTTYKKRIVKNIKNVYKGKNSFQFDLNIPAVPSMLYCVIQCGEKEFINDSIIRNFNINYTLVNTKLQFFREFIGRGKRDVTVKFKNLSTYDEFKVKCILDSAINDKNQSANFSSTNFTLGYFFDSDFLTRISNLGDTGEPISKCIVWKFNSIDNKLEFEEKAIEYGEMIIFEKFSPSNKNGCVKVIKTKTNTPTIASICIVAEDVCETNNTNHMQEILNKIKENLTTTESIKKNLGINGNFDVSTVWQITDSEDPDPSRLDFDFNFNKTNIFLSVKYKSEEKIQLECYYLDLKSRTPLNYLSIFDFIEENNTNMFYVGQQGTNISLEFANNNYDGEVYTIAANCYNLPGIKQRTKNVIKIFETFVKTKDNGEIDEKETHANCEGISIENIIPECYSMFYTFYQINTSNLLSIEQDIYERWLISSFIRLNYTSQKLRIESEKKKLRSPENIVDANYFNNFTYLGALLQYTNCSSYPSFNKCIKFKNDKIVDALNILKDFIGKENVIQTVLNYSSIYNQDILIYYLFALYSISNNQDSFAIKSSRDQMFKLANFTYKAYVPMFIEYEKKFKNVKLLSPFNVYKILFGIYSNLIDIYLFEGISLETPMYNKEEKEEYNKTLFQLKGDLEQIAYKLSSFDVLSFSFNHKGLYLTRYGDLSDNNDETTERISLQYNKCNITIYIKAQSLLKEYNSSQVNVLIYEKYPLTPLNSNVYNQHFVVIKLYTSKQGEKILDKIDEGFRPIVKYKYPDEKNDFLLCVSFNNITRIWENQGVDTKVNEENEKEVNCSISSLRDVSMIKDKIKQSNQLWMVLIVVGVIIIVVAVCLYFLFSQKTRKRHGRDMMDVIQEDPYNEDEMDEEEIKEIIE